MFDPNVCVDIIDGSFADVSYYHYRNLGVNFDERGFYPGGYNVPDSPMTCAAKRGRIGEMKLMMSLGVNPDATPDATPPEPTPLWYVALMAAYCFSMVPQNSAFMTSYTEYLRGLHLLIDAKVNLDRFTYWGSFHKSDPRDSRCGDVLTTLMALITHYPNLEVIEVLLKGGASLTVKDSKGKTAVDYAAETKNDSLIKLINGYVKPTSIVVPPTTVPPTNVPPTTVPPTCKPTPCPEQSTVTAAEEKAALDALQFYVDNGPSEQVGYYEGKDLQPYAKQAARLRQYLMPFLNNDTDLALAAGLLALYDLVVLADDSPSMKNNDTEDRINTLTAILRGLTKIYSRVGGHAEGGIRAIRWFNNKAEVDNVSSELTIDDFVGKNTFGGGASKIGTFLNKKILDVFFRKQNQNGPGRPLLVLITTDDNVNAEHCGLLETTIARSISELQGQCWMGAASIAYQFIRIGGSAGAKDLLEKLSTTFSGSPYVRTQPDQMKLEDAVAAGEKETVLMLVKLLVAPFTDLWEEVQTGACDNNC